MGTLPLLAAALLAAAPSPPAAASAPAASPAAPPSAAVAPSPAVAPLFEADLAFARAVATGDRAAFADLLEPDALFGGATQLRDGRAAVVEGWAPLLEPSSPKLTWAPADGERSTSGDLGYTIGHSRFEGPGPDGKPRVNEGRYLTVWRRGADGRWRVLFDLSYDPERVAAAPPDLKRTPVRRARAAAGDLSAEMGLWAGIDPASGPQSGAYLVVRRRQPGGAALPDVATLTTFRKPQEAKP